MFELEMDIYDMIYRFGEEARNKTQLQRLSIGVYEQRASYNRSLVW